MFKKLTALFVCTLLVATAFAYKQEEGKKNKIYQNMIGGEASKVKKYSYLYDTSLIQAIKKQDVDRIKFLLLANVNTNEKNDEGETPIAVALTYPSDEVVTMLLDKGANPNEPSKYGVTPLMTAAASSTGSRINTLLNYGADPNAKDTQNRTALMYAVETLNYDTASALLDVPKINLSAKDKKGKTAFMYVLEKNDQDMLALFTEKGIKADPKDKTMRDLFFKSVKGDNTETANMFISNGYTVDPKDAEAKAAFIAAVKNNKVEPAGILLKAGVDANSKDGLGTPALTTAVKNNNIEMATLLLDNKANVNAKDAAGKAPVVYSMKNNNDEMTQLLLSYNVKEQDEKASKNAKDSDQKVTSAAEYAIDFSSWQTSEIEDYITRTEYNLQLAKDTLEAKKMQEAQTPELTYTDDAKKPAKKPETKPKAIPKKANIAANTEQKNNTVAAAPVASSRPATTQPAPQPSYLRAENQQPIKVEYEDDNKPLDNDETLEIKTEAPRAPQNSFQEAAADFPEMDKESPAANTNNNNNNMAAARDPFEDDMVEISGQPASVANNNNDADMEDDNPYAF